jgi:hypothetical protein
MVTELVTMAILAATAGETRAMGTVDGRLKIDGQPALARSGACEAVNTVLASVVFVELDSGEATARIDITCADQSMRFAAKLPQGWYQAVVWPGAETTNLVARPYAFNTPVFVGEGKTALTFEEQTVTFEGTVRGGCEHASTLELSDIEEPYMQTVTAACVDHQLRFETRLPRGTYEVRLAERTLSEGLAVRREMKSVVLGEQRLGRR